MIALEQHDTYLTKLKELIDSDIKVNVTLDKDILKLLHNIVLNSKFITDKVLNNKVTFEEVSELTEINADSVSDAESITTLLLNNIK